MSHSSSLLIWCILIFKGCYMGFCLFVFICFPWIKLTIHLWVWKLQPATPPGWGRTCSECYFKKGQASEAVFYFLTYFLKKTSFQITRCLSGNSQKHKSGVFLVCAAMAAGTSTGWNGVTQRCTWLCSTFRCAQQGICVFCWKKLSVILPSSPLQIKIYSPILSARI